MIGAVYKGIMKAVARELTRRLEWDYSLSERYPESVLSYEHYLVHAEQIAYDEICKAFRLSRHWFQVSGFEGLVTFVRWTVAQMGMDEGCMEFGEDTIYGCIESHKCKYISVPMPNRKWRFMLYPGGLVLSTVPSSEFETAQVNCITPSQQLFAVLPDLDRMCPVLERMTGNLMDDAAKADMVSRIKSVSEKHSR